MPRSYRVSSLTALSLSLLLASPAHAAPSPLAGATSTVADLPRPTTNARTSSGDWLFGGSALRGVVALNALSLGGAFTDTDGGGPALGGSVISNHDVIVGSSKIARSTRAHLRTGIGGGQAGFDGRLGGLFTFGPAFGDRSLGFSPRLGLDGELRGNDFFSRSSFALPRLDLAVDVHPFVGFLVELGVSGAYGWLDRVTIDGVQRKSGGRLQAGPFVATGFRTFTLTVQTQRTFVVRPVDGWDAHACWSARSLMMLCANHTGARFGDRLAQTMVVSIGLGAGEVH